VRHNLFILTTPIHQPRGAVSAATSPVFPHNHTDRACPSRTTASVSHNVHVSASYNCERDSVFDGLRDASLLLPRSRSPRR
jgi:hypothetical protein